MAKRKTKSLDALEVQPVPTAPLDGGIFLDAAQDVLKELDRDLLERAKASTSVTRALRARHQQERDAERTGDNYDVWLRQFVGQVGAAWLLSTVFVRTLEDRGLLGRNRVAGPGALDSQRLFFELAPSLTERDYLLTVFRELSRFPAARALFDTQHNPVWALAPSAASAKKLLELFRLPDAGAPAFRFGQSDTRFLGDLYQDLDEAVKKRFALLQTPHFIESFILDRTLEPAIEHFGLDDTTLIDPTCGSGHFLLGAFDRLFERRLAKEPGLDARQAALKALDAIFGADINPYAVAITRFRLTLSFLEKAGFTRLADGPEVPLHLAVADSLLHNPHFEQRKIKDIEGISSQEWEGDLFALEDEIAARDVLHRQYAAIVGNPPYITVKDKVLRDRYRSLYRSASGKYSVAVPFTERFFHLGRAGARVGMITANSFMKREFGQKLIEDFLPTVNLDVIVNTSGAYIPGHGTPTVLLFGSSEPPKRKDVLAVLASRGEPSTPDEPEKGEVWSSIAEHWDDVGFENDYISVARVEREKLADHPWSLAGGGAGELKALLELNSDETLGDRVSSIGFMAITGEDDVFARPYDAWERADVESEWLKPFGIGEEIRDWAISPSLTVAFPYKDARLRKPPEYPRLAKRLWPYRRLLLNRPDFGGKKYIDVGRPWYSLHQVPLERLRTPMSIAFAFVATHNHFVLDRGGKVFNRTAPIIKLSDSATEDDHLALLAYVNSSTACFFLKQVCQSKGLGGQGGGIKPEEWHRQMEFDGTKVGYLPLPSLDGLEGFARTLSSLAEQRDSYRGIRWVNRIIDKGCDVEAAAGSEKYSELTHQMVAVQDELDWEVYRRFGLTQLEVVHEPEPIAPELRPMEILFCESIAERDVTTNWHNVHERAPATTSALKGLDVRTRLISSERMTAIKASRELKLLESPDYKRRWEPLDWDADIRSAAVSCALRQLEGTQSTSREPATLSRAELRREIESLVGSGGKLRRVSEFLDPSDVLDSVTDTCVPFLSHYRLTTTGLAKFDVWKHVWECQRQDDAGGNVGGIPVPPKYAKNDFSKPSYWSLRGKLDVPKERFISYPGCASDEDGEPVYGWAGWNHLERAQALAALYQNRKDREGWETKRLTPMLAGLLELITWVKQWHNEPSDEYGGMRLGDYFESFLDGECQRHGLTREDLESWRPPETMGRRKKRGARA